jgi:hypothetical protein
MVLGGMLNTVSGGSKANVLYHYDKNSRSATQFYRIISIY